jgi:DNA-binding response OmpR family regulator
MKKLLLLEDDMVLNETVSDYLQTLHYEVVTLYDGEEALSKIYEERFDLLILDVNVPGIDGFELLKEVRSMEVSTPAIYITSLNSMDDLEVGFEAGCDDYIRKPFALKELALRVETLLKREFYHTNEERITIDDQISYDPINDQLLINSEKITLHNKEAKLLQLFLQHQDVTLSHQQIYDRLWEYDEQVSESALRTYIKNLRKLIGKDRIVSIKKLGYRFTTE